MATLDSIVSVTVDKRTATVSRLGFGVPMVMSIEADEDNRFAETAKAYTSITQLGSAGDNYDLAGVTYQKVQRIFQQNPKVKQVVVGKRPTAPIKKVVMVPVVKNSTEYELKIGGRGVAGGDVETFSFTSDATATAAEIIAALVTAIDAGAQNVDATDTGPGTSLDIETAATPGGAATAGKPFTLEYDRSLWTVQDVTADAGGLVSDLTAIRTALDGNDDWYALHIDTAGKAEILAMAAHIETLFKIFVATTLDADVLTSATDDVSTTMQALNYERTALTWYERPELGLDAAWAGDMLPRDPGSATWKFKTLIGIAVSVLTEAEMTKLIAKGCNYYVTIAGVDIMTEGVMVGGEYIDVTRGIDFITQRMKENVFGQMAALPKLGFSDDDGIAVVEAQVRGVMSLGVSQKIFSKDPAPVVTVPLAADIDSVDKANRKLTDVVASGTLEGAIHSTEIELIVTV
jgi:hypothetical protein